MAGIRLEFAQFGHFDSFDIIRSMTSMNGVADVDLPAPIATGVKTMYYVDSNVVKGTIYYYKVRVWRGGVSVMSSEIKCLADFDKYWANVVSLLHFDDNLIDEKGLLSYSVVDSISYSSNAKFNKALNLTGRTGLLTVSNNSIKVGGSDYTIECYINAASFTKVTAEPVIFSIGNNNNSGSQEIILGVVSSTGKLFYRVYQNGTYIVNNIKSSASITLNQWTHVAITRSGLNHYIFIDGVLSAAYTSSSYSLADVTVDLIIGGIISSGSNKNWGRFDGLIDEFRFTKGVARYTENFTPQDNPFMSS